MISSMNKDSLSLESVPLNTEWTSKPRAKTGEGDVKQTINHYTDLRNGKDNENSTLDVKIAMNHCNPSLPSYISIESEIPSAKVDERQSTTTSDSKRLLGVFLILCSTGLFSGLHASVRHISSKLGISILVVSFLRGVFQVLVVLAAILYLGYHEMINGLTANSYKLLALRGLFGAMAMCTKFFCLSQLSVGVSSALFSTTPMFAVLIGACLLNEKVTSSGYVSLALTTAGALIVAMSTSSPEGSPIFDSQSNSMAGVSLGLSTSLLTAFVYTMIRGMGEQVHFLLSLMSFGLFSIIVPPIFQLLYSDTSTVTQVFHFFKSSLHTVFTTANIAMAMAIVVIFAFSAAAFLNRGVQLVTVGQSAVIRTWDIPFNFLTGWIVLGEQPLSWGEAIGCVLITIGVYVNAKDNSKD